jgi:hypothetical protein
MKNQKELPSHKIFVHSLLSSVNDILDFLKLKKKKKLEKKSLFEGKILGFKNNAKYERKDKGLELFNCLK